MHEIVIALIVGMVVCVLAIRWVNNTHKRKQSRLHDSMRDIATAERDKQLRAARQRGDFDQWGSDSDR